MCSSSTSVRGLAAIVAVCALACLGAASASAAPLAYVADRQDNSVSMIDTATNETLGKPIAVGEGPDSIAITPDARFAYVANGGSNDVSVIELVTNRVIGSPIPVGEGPEQIAVSPNGETAYVADTIGEEISVIDTRTNQVVAEIPLSDKPDGIAISPNGETAYVTSLFAGTVEIIDTQREEVVGEPIQLGDFAESVAFSPDGKTAYVAMRTGVAAIATGTHQVKLIPFEPAVSGIEVTPGGEEAFAVGTGSLHVIDLQTDRQIKEVPVGIAPQEIAIVPDGRTAYVTDVDAEDVRAVDTQTYEVAGPPIEMAGLEPAGIAITPDRSPTAAFAGPDITAGTSATFNGAASSDPDGTVSSYSWAFGDGGVGSGVSPSHTYSAPGTYNAELTVEDNEGCGEEEVFTGRTAYCSGNIGASVANSVIANPPAVVPVVSPSNKFVIRRLIHNRRNGTVRMQVKLPNAGYVLLFGKKVHAVTRKSKGVQSMWLTIHARVELNKRLKKIHRAPVRIRVTFTPNGGTPRTMHRTVALLRAPRRH